MKRQGSNGMPKSRKGRPKGDKRQRTRARLLEAASLVIRQKGFYRTTLEDVARQAGMTRGAIYGNFLSREDLFLSVLDTRWRPIVPLKACATLREHLRAVGEAVVAAVPARRAQALGAFSLQIYALTHEATRARVAELNAEVYRRAGQHLGEQLPAGELPMPAEQFVLILHALTDGLLSLRLVQPELLSDDLIVRAFETMA
jgi:AcrR family transcriptional regulator